MIRASPDSTAVTSAVSRCLTAVLTAGARNQTFASVILGTRGSTAVSLHATLLGSARVRRCHCQCRTLCSSSVFFFQATATVRRSNSVRVTRVGRATRATLPRASTSTSARCRASASRPTPASATPASKGNPAARRRNPTCTPRSSRPATVTR